MTTGASSKDGGRLDDRIIEAEQREVRESVPKRRPITFRAAVARCMKNARPHGTERPNLDAIDQAHLDRWVKDPRAEEVWQKIQELAFKFWPASTNFDLMLDTFIAIVPFARRIAENAPDPKTTTDQQKRRSLCFQNRAEVLEDLARIWRKQATFQKKVEEEDQRILARFEEKHGNVEDLWGTQPAPTSKEARDILRQLTPEQARELSKLDQAQEEARDFFRQLKARSEKNNPISKIAFKKAEMYESEARLWRRLSQRPVAPSTLSRQASSRKQRFFMHAVSKFLILLCGRPMDDETAVLNDIAFDTAEATTPLQARSARRPSTRLARLKSHKSGAQNPKKCARKNKKKHVATMR